MPDYIGKDLTTTDQIVKANMEVTGSVSINGSLKVDGQTVLDSVVSGSESLIVSGAMSIVDQQVGSAVASSSLFIENLGTLANKDLSGVIDLGDGFQ